MNLRVEGSFDRGLLLECYTIKISRLSVRGESAGRTS